MHSDSPIPKPARERAARLRGRTVALLSALTAAAALASACGDAGPPERPSPSEGLVVVLPRGESGADLAVVRLSDGASAMLTKTPDRSKGSPRWLPALQRVLFTEPVLGEDPPRIRLMLVDPMTYEVRSASDNPLDLEIQPTTSEDGKFVAYVFAGPTRSGYGQGIKLLRLMNAQDRIFRVPGRGAVFRNPRLSPDALSVVVEVQRPNSGADLRILRDGDSDVDLTRDRRMADSGPRFSRGGGVVYFERRVLPGRAGEGDSQPLGGGDVCSVHLETQEVQCTFGSEDAREYGVEPSPTRDEVAFFREKDGRVELVVSDAQGRSPRTLLVASRPDPLHLAWSPDGERLAFSSGDARAETTTVVDREGEILIETPGSAPAWVPPMGPAFVSEP